ncbi:MAG: hypothetical protein KDB27_36620 [Planctomycetales bacterium]|nr:hypothetical protein [Planctomycetales bacterium]MCA9218669.1 hypothetical protein [Planctomycetales bacterium]
MLIFSQRASRHFLLAAYVAVSVVGHGLHYLPGVQQHGIDRDGVSECPHCCHHSRHAESGNRDQDSPESPDDCVVCRVLAQSIDVVEPIEPLTSEFFVFLESPATTSQGTPFSGDCRSRGPPAIGGIFV